MAAAVEQADEADHAADQHPEPDQTEADGAEGRQDDGHDHEGTDQDADQGGPEGLDPEGIVGLQPVRRALAPGIGDDHGQDAGDADDVADQEKAVIERGEELVVAVRGLGRAGFDDRV